MSDPKKDAEELRAATREAHEAIKDLTRITREAKAAVELLRAEPDRILSEHVVTTVREGLNQYQATLDKAINEATEKVYERFDKVTDILLGENRKAKLRGDPSITELAERMAADRDGTASQR
jgi:hypothetical protein